MKRVISIATAGVTALLLALTISVNAQDFNPMEKTFLTFSGPVELPGLRLEAGTYVFKLADTAGRNVVQVLTRDEKEILGQWLFVQAERPAVSGETVVTFKETREGATPAIQYWYYPGEKIGKEFVSPREQAVQIAARTGTTVKSTEGEISANSEIATVQGEGRAALPEPAPAQSRPAQEPAPAAAAAREPEPAPAAEPAAPAPAQRAEATVRQEPQAVGTAGELPQTSSPLVWSGLLGLLALAGAAGVRFMR